MPLKPTYEADVISAASQKAAYDESCKKVLALKEIAARILAAVAEEFKGCSIDEIISCMGSPEIGNIPVDADTPVIPLENSEDSTATEGKRFFDIKFTVKVPVSGEYIHLIINLEAQREFDPGYSLIKRGIYYCSRLISSQYGSVFIKSDYDKIRKVYSIWVCTNPTEGHRRTVTQYSMSKKSIEGEIKFGDPKDAEKERSDYDLLSLVMICLDDPDSPDMPKTGIIRMLSLLFAENMDLRAKITMLEDEYNIKMTEEIEEEVERMCNLSEGIWDKGINTGIEIGIERGIEKGEIKGKADIFKVLLDKNMSFEEIVKLTDVTNETAEQIREYLKRHTS